MLRILSIDHGAHDLVPMAEAVGADPARIPAFKRLAVKAAAQVAKGRAGFGVFLDAALGADALVDARAAGLWTSRQYPHGEVDDLTLWHRDTVIKLIANGRADARTPIDQRLPEVIALANAAKRRGLSLLVEALAAAGEPITPFIKRLYDAGISPDYWLIEAAIGFKDGASLDRLVAAKGPNCKGLIVIARNAQAGPEIAAARTHPHVMGFVGGRAIFGPAFTGWLSGALDDQGAVNEMAQCFAALSQAFEAG